MPALLLLCSLQWGRAAGGVRPVAVGGVGGRGTAQCPPLRSSSPKVCSLDGSQHAYDCPSAKESLGVSVEGTVCTSVLCVICSQAFPGGLTPYNRAAGPVGLQVLWSRRIGLPTGWGVLSPSPHPLGVTRLSNCFELMFLLHSFTCGYLVFPAPFVENAVLSPLNGLSILVKSHVCEGFFLGSLFFPIPFPIHVFMPESQFGITVTMRSGSVNLSVLFFSGLLRLFSVP